MEEGKEVAAQMTEKQELPSMPKERRASLLNSLQHLNDSFPEATVVGGVALRAQYESKTGKEMFGDVKGDIDAYLPTGEIKKIIENPPEQYRVKREFLPGESYVALEDKETFDHLDLFGENPFYTPQVEKINIEGVEIRTLTVEELLAEKLADLRRNLDEGRPIETRHLGYLKLLKELVSEKKMNKVWQSRKEAKQKESETKLDSFISSLETLAGKSNIRSWSILVEQAVQEITEGKGITAKSGQKLIEKISNLRQKVPLVESEEFTTFIKEIKDSASPFLSGEYSGNWQEAEEQFPVPESAGSYFRKEEVEPEKLKPWLKFGEQTKPATELEEIGKNIKGEGLDYINGVLSWMKDYFKPCKEEDKERLLYSVYLTKTANEIVKSGVEIACSDKALVFATLMRIKGIPAKYVETVQIACIEDENEQEVKQHAFSEVFVEGSWVLVDPQGGEVEKDVNYERLGYLKFREGLDAWNLGWHKLENMESEAKRFIEEQREKIKRY